MTFFFYIIVGNHSPVDSNVVDLTQGSSDDEDLNEEMVSTHLEDKKVHFRKSGKIKTPRSKSRSRTINRAAVVF